MAMLRARKVGAVVACWIFVLLGLGFLAGAGYAAWAQKKFLSQATTTTGTVVGYTQTSGAGTGYTPIFEFKDAGGIDHRITTRTSTNPPAHLVGETVVVHYLPTDPAGAEMDGFTDKWLLAAILGGMGLIFAGAASVALLVLWWTGKPKAAKPPPLPQSS